MNFDTSSFCDFSDLKDKYWTATGYVVDGKIICTGIVKTKEPIEELVEDGYTFREINKMNLEKSV